MAGLWNGSRTTPLQAAQQISWDFNSKFFIEPSGKFFKDFVRISSQGEILDFNAHLETFDILDIVSDNLEVYTGGSWLQAPGRLNCNRVTLKLRDYNQGKYYTAFANAIKECNSVYPEDQFAEFKVYLEPSWAQQNAKPIALLSNCILFNVGGLTLDNGSKQMTSLSIVFICPEVTIL